MNLNRKTLDGELLLQHPLCPEDGATTAVFITFHNIFVFPTVTNIFTLYSYRLFLVLFSALRVFQQFTTDRRRGMVLCCYSVPHCPDWNMGPKMVVLKSWHFRSHFQSENRINILHWTDMDETLLDI